MVDISLLQSLSYVAAAIGVCVAAFYYMMMLRINQRNMRITLTNNLMQSWQSYENQRRWGELLNMEWRDYDDFEKKYGSDNNLDNFALRQSMFYQLNSLGELLRSGLADGDTLFSTVGVGATWIWLKFKSVLEENRRRYSGKYALSGFEYLADEMMKIRRVKDPDYKIPETFARYVPDK